MKHYRLIVTKMVYEYYDFEAASDEDAGEMTAEELGRHPDDYDEDTISTQLTELEEI